MEEMTAAEDHDLFVLNQKLEADAAFLLLFVHVLLVGPSIEGSYLFLAELLLRPPQYIVKVLQ